MRVIIAGSRSFIDFDRLLAHMSVFPVEIEITEIVSGGARGADLLGEVFAGMFNYPVKQFIPDWDGLGKRAGFVRNAEMANYADVLVAFWDGESRGTKHMIDCMSKLKKKVIVHKI